VKLTVGLDGVTVPLEGVVAAKVELAKIARARKMEILNPAFMTRFPSSLLIVEPVRSAE
jgi:hypothetical protein